LILLIWALASSFAWEEEAQGAPQVIVWITLAITASTLGLSIFKRGVVGYLEGSALDLTSDLGDLDRTNTTCVYLSSSCGYADSFWSGGLAVFYLRQHYSLLGT